MTEQINTQEVKQPIIATLIDLVSYDTLEKAIDELKRLFDKNRNFWGKAPLIIKFDNFLFTEESSNELKILINEFELNIVSIQTNSVRSWKYLRAKGFEVNAVPVEENPEDKSLKSNVKVSHSLTNFRESFKNAIPKKVEEEPRFTPARPQPSSNNNNNGFEKVLPHNAIEIPTAYIHTEDNIALRSGQRVVYDGNLIIFGDTNPGCQIFATGSIIVYGKLCGNVHAGWNVKDDDQLENVYIKALLMGDPLQVNIGKYSACSSDEQKKFMKKHKIYPETAKVVDNQIWRFPDFT